AHRLPAALPAWPGGRASVCVYERVGSPIPETPDRLHLAQQQNLLIAPPARRASPSRPPDRLSPAFGALQGLRKTSRDGMGPIIAAPPSPVVPQPGRSPGLETHHVVGWP